jgi:pimeloyl-ACP methyl ester carboxylesterase
MNPSHSNLIEIRKHGKSGPTIVLLHGGPGAPGSVTSLATALASDFKVLEPFQRRSENEALSVERHCLDLAAVWPEKMLLVGWSWGAMLALSFASRYPERAAAVVLIGCGTYDSESREIYQQKLHRRLGSTGISRLKAIQRRIASEVDRETRDRLFGELARIVSRAQSFATNPIDEGNFQVDSRGHEETWQDVLRLQDEGVEPAKFRAIKAPVLMLHGDDDPHPGEATRDVLRRYIAHLEYVGFARGGHAPWLEPHVRDLFLRTLRNWLLDHSLE